MHYVVSVFSRHVLITTICALLCCLGCICTLDQAPLVHGVRVTTFMLLLMLWAREYNTL